MPKNSEIMMRTYMASMGTSFFVMGTVAVIEVIMLIISVLNEPLYGPFLWRYRAFYIALLCMVLCYTGIMLYIKKDFEKRFRILDSLNPLSAAFFFIWSIGITYHDYLQMGTVDPAVFMTFSLTVPICFYMLPSVYGLIAVLADAAMLFLAVKVPNGPALAINMFIYFAFQMVLGISVLTLKRVLSKEILIVEAQRNEIEKLSAARSLFFSSVSHEIRTPVNAVLGMNDMILRESRDTKISEYAENIRTAGKSLLGVVNDILDFSKLESGRMEIVPEEYHTAVLFSDAAMMVADSARRKGLSFVTDVDSTLPSRLYGDDVRIRQVISNLLSNAVKYTERGSIVLKARYSKLDEDNIALRVSVEDTGIGIREEDVRKLFNAFERLDEKRNRGVEGAGLGLSITEDLLELMGSRLDVSSEYGKGSEFSFLLNQKVASWEPVGDIDSVAKRLKKQERVFREDFVAPEARVLVVDDVDMNIKVFTGFLKQSEIQIDTASSGTEALAKMREHVYDCVFMDHMMPGMDGIQTLETAREDSRIRLEGVPVIALTANAVTGARKMYLSHGFSDYLSKPVDRELLFGLLKKWLPGDKIREKDGVSGGESVPGNEPVTEFAPQEEEILEFLPGDGKVSEFAPQEISGSSVCPDETLDRLKETGLNVDSGLGHAMGDPAFYLEIVNDFAQSFSQKHEVLQEALEKSDWKNYEVFVHAVKSTSKTVGADELAGLAASLEKAASAGDAEFIRKNHAIFMRKFEEKASQIIRSLPASHDCAD